MMPADRGRKAVSFCGAIRALSGPVSESIQRSQSALHGVSCPSLPPHTYTCMHTGTCIHAHTHSDTYTLILTHTYYMSLPKHTHAPTLIQSFLSARFSFQSVLTCLYSKT